MQNKDIPTDTEKNQSLIQADKFKETIQKTTYVVIALLALVLFASYRLDWFHSAEPLKNLALNMGWAGFLLLSILVILNNIILLFRVTYPV
ncbi:hypothetical protein [Aerococcus viridans]|uniref:Uncharacterized protein n=1 Tax=Aerococcus viridans TaxID=1377 RepID=A0A2J9PPF5_9LACT|nr:hypothetical protein [Aerococcus viridans]PNL92228.1 hypothetical protein A6J77_008300 [Aerococcus viridans]